MRRLGSAQRSHKFQLPRHRLLARRLLFCAPAAKAWSNGPHAVSAVSLRRQLGTASQGQMSAFEASLLLVQNAASDTLGSIVESAVPCANGGFTETP